MPERMLIPSVEKRLENFMELTRKAAKEVIEKEKKKPAITISREFGCGGYPVAEKLKAILEEKTNEQWPLMDKALLDEVAKTHHLIESVLARLGEKSRVVEDVISTFSPNWLTEHDYYRLLCREILALAVGGNVIIVGRGSAIVTQALDNCFHFRLFASLGFKMEYIARCAGLSASETELFIEKKQRQREAFVRDFLNRDSKELKYYHLVFNNDKNSSERIAGIIADYVLSS
jgi:hypothetical protein